MRVLTVRGISGSGKTTTIEKLIAQLRERGHSVGSVKDIHFEDFAIDTEGTNTYRHRQAGSQLVTARGLKETDVLIPHRLTVESILGFYDHDYVVLEGVDDYDVPEIICAASTDEADNLISPLTIALAGKVSGDIREYKGLPVINALESPQDLADLVERKVPPRLPNVDPECCSRCGLSCREMLAAILRGERTRSDCQLRTGAVRLYINGQELPMVEFVRDILRDTVLGVVSNLKGYREHGHIEVRITREG